MKVYVKSPSRLHFTLIDLNGELGRIDGSVGVALNYPNVILEASKADSIIIEGLIPNRVKRLAKKFIKAMNINEGFKINVKKVIPSHVGLGSSTQLSLSIASALAKLFNINIDVKRLAEIMGRGGTSGIGVAAFQYGGFIVDGGHPFKKKKGKKAFLPSRAAKAAPPPIIVRYDFPLDWFFTVAIPNISKGFYGEKETKAFKAICPTPSVEAEKISRLILMKMLPALKELSIEEFGEALTELQNISVSKKSLIHPIVKKCIEKMLDNGAYGAGQSSWGPAVYGLVKGKNKAEKLTKKIKSFIYEEGGGEVFYTSVNNKGANIKVLR
ncbi:MAG: beta-ribofuranosylaminobenzene 5'-phosphate synthase [Candidatus Bathyarchaeia archaeon]|nr:beta-ribofuranosylaminobenzene 5'-phosphate synthase [Candidatus Bathyarchaeota archaeon]